MIIFKLKIKLSQTKKNRLIKQNIKKKFKYYIKSK